MKPRAVSKTMSWSRDERAPEAAVGRCRKHPVGLRVVSEVAGVDPRQTVLDRVDSVCPVAEPGDHLGGHVGGMADDGARAGG